MKPLNRRQKILMRLAGVDFPEQKKQKEVVGSFLNFGDRRLSTEKSASSKLIEACYGWVYINSSILAEAVSKLEIKLYRTGYKNGQLDLQEVQTHPLLDLLDRFNDSTTSSEGFYITESHLNLVGNSYWYTPLKNGEPSAILPLRPDKVELKLGQFKAESPNLIDAYVYKDVIDGKKVEVVYSPEEIVPIKVPNESNMFRGKSTVEAIANDIDIDTYAGQTLREFFENGMIVQFALTTDQRINNDQIANFQSQLRSTFGGAKNAWKVPIFGGGIKPTELQMSSKDMQLIEQMKWLRDKIMIAFKNTPASIGIIEDVNRANSESTLANWKSSVIKPKMARIVDSLNEYLVPKYGDNLILGFEDPSPEDSGQDSTEAVNLYRGGIITQNEAREMLGMDATQDGDQFYSSPSPFGPLPKAVANVNYKAVFRRSGVTKEFEAYKKFYEKTLPIVTEKLKKPKVKDSTPVYSFDIDKAQNYASNQLKIVDHHEQIFDNAVKQILNNVVEEGLHNFKSAEARKKNELVDKKKWIEESVNKLSPILTQVVIQAGNQANRLLNIDQPYIPKSIKTVDTKKFIREQIELFMGSAVDTDVDTMVDIIAAGLTEELSVPQIRAQIVDKFQDYTKMQAERITRTEVIKTSNLGAQDAFEQSGVVEAKQWLATDDDRTDEECLAMDGQIVGLEDDYDSVVSKLLPDVADSILGYSSVDYPPLHPNCRCVILPVLVGEKKVIQIVDKEAGKREKALQEKIAELESKIDKRTKEYRDLKSVYMDDKAYLKSLERCLDTVPKKSS